MQKLFINSSESIQTAIQNYFNKNEEARFIHRLHGILLKLDNQDSTCDSIGKLFGQSARTISSWIKKVNAAGDIEVLRDKKKSGRQPKLNQHQLTSIKEAIAKHPEESGVSANIWDGKSLSYYIEKTYAVTLGVRQCQRLFKKLGFSLKRARPKVAKGNAQAKAMAKKTSRNSKK